MNQITNFYQDHNQIGQNKAIVSMGYDNIETNITLSQGHGSTFPDPSFVGPYNVVWWNASDYTSPIDDPHVEIVRCIAKIGNTLIVMRSQQQTLASPKNISGKSYNMTPLPYNNLETLSYYNVPQPHGSASHTGTIGDHTTNLSNVGSNTHTQIDTAITTSAGHIAASGTSVHSLGTMSTQSAGSVTITGGSIAGITSMGIGTASPGDTLTVEGNINLGNSGHRIGFNQNIYSPVTGAYSIGVVASGNFPFRITGADDVGTNRPFQIGYYSSDNVANTFNVAMHVNTYNGNVGIGTTSPGEKLEVSGNIGISIRNSIGFQYGIVDSWYRPSYGISFYGSNGAVEMGGVNFLSHPSGTSPMFGFRSSDTNALLMSIISGGNVGIGTPNPSTRLHVGTGITKSLNGYVQIAAMNGDHCAISISSPNNKVCQVLFGDDAADLGSITYNNATDALSFTAGGSTGITINNGGALTLGTDLAITEGGTGLSATVAYTPICGGTTTTGAMQSVASTGTAGQVLMSNGAGTLPSFQTVSVGSAGWTLVTKTSAFTAASDNTILCNAVGGIIVISLPAAASNANKIYNIKKIDSSGNSVTIDANASETIDGTITKSLNTQYESITIQCDGANWYII